MNWLLHNVVADLYGPYFLAFYAMVIGVVIVACYRSVRGVDQTGDLELPSVPAKVDPYEIAYLRGGENEVTRIAVASLIQRGLLQITEEKHRLSTTKKIDRGRRPDTGELTTTEAQLLKWPGFPAAPAALFQPNGLSQRVKEACVPYEADLAEKHLLAPPEMRDFGIRLWGIGTVIILGLGGYKLAVALAKGHGNVAFLCILGVVGVILLGVACTVLPRASHLGKAYLQRLKLAYTGLMDRGLRGGEPAFAMGVAGEPSRPGKVKAATAYSDCLLSLGVFGIASLAGTSMAELNTLFARGASSGGCGAGCGGGGCGGGGCGGGCGGCGG
jgi:uncharacterized protein (TIGR04222 family)